MTDEDTQIAPTDRAAEDPAYDMDFEDELVALATDAGEWFRLPTSVDGDVLVYGVTDKTPVMDTSADFFGRETRIQVSHDPERGEYTVSRFDGNRAGGRFCRSDVGPRRSFEGAEAREAALDMVALLTSRYDEQEGGQ